MVNYVSVGISVNVATPCAAHSVLFYWKNINERDMLGRASFHCSKNLFPSHREKVSTTLM